MNLLNHRWASLGNVRAQFCYSRSQVQPLVVLWFRAQNHRFQVIFRFFGVLSLLSFFNLHSSEPQVIGHGLYHPMSLSIPGFSLSCPLKLDSSNPSTSSSTSMCSEWSLNPLMAFEISDHAAGNSALGGLRFLASTSRYGADMITSYFPSNTYTNFNPSGSYAYPANTAFGINFVKAPSFNTSIISPMDS